MKETHKADCQQFNGALIITINVIRYFTYIIYSREYIVTLEAHVIKTDLRPRVLIDSAPAKYIETRGPPGGGGGVLHPNWGTMLSTSSKFGSKNL